MSGRNLAGGVTILLGVPVAALAQERQLEEIVVTTEHRAASEAVTAISKEVLSGTDLAAADIKDIADLQNAVPSLQVIQNGLYVQANIRGAGKPFDW